MSSKRNLCEEERIIEHCLQNKDRELTQHRHELQRLRQTITEVIGFSTHAMMSTRDTFSQMSSDLHPDDTRQLMQKLK